jgi:glycosyltransferase involved in cell wall biosynthesis
MKIAIIGTRGIPNHYGGFEQFAEYLAKGLVERGHDITVYNSHMHPYQEAEWNGVKLVHCNDPEDKWGTVGQFVYDLNCIMDTRKKNFDIILQLGYTSSTVWGWLLPRKHSIVTTNMDGLEWSRSKYSKPVQWFLKQAEYLATVFSDHWISDSVGIQDYLTKKYNIPSTYIPYGAFPFSTPNRAALDPYQVTEYGYNMLVARFEPENNLDAILEGAANAATKTPFLVVGKHATRYGAYLKEKFKDHSHIRFIGGVYDIEILNNLRYYSNIYFHGHSVGGTNPSLLEAMASHTLICANQNMFNSAILGKDAFYFSNAEEVTNCIDSVQKHKYSGFVDANVQKIVKIYEWNNIIDQYENHFTNIYSTKHEIQHHHVK